ncbi:MAG TPA: type II secretion system protein, partial [bacterium]|nr:type II secretion system protein [bacterium]
MNPENTNVARKRDAKGAWSDWLTGLDVLLVFVLALGTSFLVYEAKQKIRYETYGYESPVLVWCAPLILVSLFGLSMRIGRNLLYFIAGIVVGIAVITFGDVLSLSTHLATFVALGLMLALFNGWAWRSWLALPRVRALRREEKEYMKRMSGMTLIEILIVIALIGVMSAGLIRMEARTRITGQQLE